jgi:hypothetical protein
MSNNDNHRRFTNPITSKTNSSSPCNFPINKRNSVYNIVTDTQSQKGETNLPNENGIQSETSHPVETSPPRETGNNQTI